MLKHITLERLQEIEAERAQTETDPNFKTWMHELRVGTLCITKDGITRAQQMMADWNQSPLNQHLWE
jgi:hypothetical protein